MPGKKGSPPGMIIAFTGGLLPANQPVLKGFNKSKPIAHSKKKDVKQM
jgi:hypothetical protein